MKMVNAMISKHKTNKRGGGAVKASYPSTLHVLNNQHNVSREEKKNQLLNLV